jgi:hypothetical protein
MASHGSNVLSERSGRDAARLRIEGHSLAFRLVRGGHERISHTASAFGLALPWSMPSLATRSSSTICESRSLTAMRSRSNVPLLSPSAASFATPAPRSAHNVVAFEDRSRLVTGQHHCDTFGHASTNEVADRGAAEVVRDAARTARVTACGDPGATIEPDVAEASLTQPGQPALDPKTFQIGLPAR